MKFTRKWMDRKIMVMNEVTTSACSPSHVHVILESLDKCV